MIRLWVSTYLAPLRGGFSPIACSKLAQTLVLMMLLTAVLAWITRSSAPLRPSSSTQRLRASLREAGPPTETHDPPVVERVHGTGSSTDSVMWCSPSFRFDPPADRAPSRRFDLGGIESAFVVTDVLSRDEAARMVTTVAERTLTLTLTAAMTLTLTLPRLLPRRLWASSERRRQRARVLIARIAGTVPSHGYGMRSEPQPRPQPAPASPSPAAPQPSSKRCPAPASRAGAARRDASRAAISHRASRAARAAPAQPRARAADGRRAHPARGDLAPRGDQPRRRARALWQHGGRRATGRHRAVGARVRRCPRGRLHPERTKRALARLSVRRGHAGRLQAALRRGVARQQPPPGGARQRLQRHDVRRLALQLRRPAARSQRPGLQLRSPCGHPPRQRPASSSRAALWAREERPRCLDAEARLLSMAHARAPAQSRRPRRLRPSRRKARGRGTMATESRT